MLVHQCVHPLLDTDSGGGGGDRSDENQSCFHPSGKETRSSMTLSQQPEERATMATGHQGGGGDDERERDKK